MSRCNEAFGVVEFIGLVEFVGLVGLVELVEFVGGRDVLNYLIIFLLLRTGISESNFWNAI
jgi:hypothetical protein